MRWRRGRGTARGLSFWRMARIPLLLTWILLTGWLAAQERAPALPAELSDKAFWQLIVDVSEPDGHFEDENFVSNEMGYQRVMPRLQEAVQPGGVYVGVGPEQNFSYIAALRPKMAFVVDIRRQNMIEHLMYKALFELSEDRVDFLSRLFSRPALRASIDTRMSPICSRPSGRHSQTDNSSTKPLRGCLTSWSASIDWG
jgi:hypothetical protein